MNETESEETRSFRDPMAARLEAARVRKEEQESGYPQVRAVYDGFYVFVDEVSQEGSRFFLGAEGIIGSELSFNEGSFSLYTDDERELLVFEDPARSRLASLLAQGWHISVYLSATFFRSEDKSAAAEIACICWAPLSRDHEDSLQQFSRNIAERLASGDRAGLSLTQEQFISVLRSKGSWYLTPTTKRDPLAKGTIVYKNHRTAIERLTGFALRHRTGCNVLASLFWLALLGALVILIWRLFFA